MSSADSEIRQRLNSSVHEGTVDIDAVWDGIVRRARRAHNLKIAVGVVFVAVIGFAMLAVIVGARHERTSQQVVVGPPSTPTSTAPVAATDLATLGELVATGVVSETATAGSRSFGVRLVNGTAMRIVAPIDVAEGLARLHVVQRARLDCSEACGATDLTAEFGNIDRGGVELARYTAADGSTWALVDERGIEYLIAHTAHWTVRLLAGGLAEPNRGLWARSVSFSEDGSGSLLVGGAAGVLAPRRHWVRSTRTLWCIHPRDCRRGAVLI